MISTPAFNLPILRGMQEPAVVSNGLTQSEYDNTMELMFDTLGQTISDALAQPDVKNVIRLADGEVWVDTHTERYPLCLHPNAYAEAFLRQLSFFNRRRFDMRKPEMDAVLPIFGARVKAKMPPIAQGFTYTMRKHLVQVLTLDDWVRQGVMSPSQRRQIQHSIDQGHSIIIGGAPGKGKTTLMKTICHECVASFTRRNGHPPFDVTLEAIREIGKVGPAGRTEITDELTKPPIDEQALVKGTLRDNPDMMFFGEAIGREAFDLFQAMGLGIQLISTLHTKSARKVPLRFENLISQNEGIKPNRPEIAEMIDLVIYIGEGRDGRRLIHDVATVYWNEDLNTYDFDSRGVPGEGEANLPLPDMAAD